MNKKKLDRAPPSPLSNHMQRLWTRMLDRASRLLSQHLSYVPIISWVPVGTAKSVPTSTEISANFAASIVFTRRMRCRDCNTTRYVRYCLAIASLSIHLFFFQDCLLQHKLDMEKSFAVARSRDKACGICMEIIWEKLPSTKQRFGLLPNCSHCFW